LPGRKVMADSAVLIWCTGCTESAPLAPLGRARGTPPELTAPATRPQDLRDPAGRLARCAEHQAVREPCSRSGRGRQLRKVACRVVVPGLRRAVERVPVELDDKAERRVPHILVGGGTGDLARMLAART